MRSPGIVVVALLASVLPATAAAPNGLVDEAIATGTRFFCVISS